ncbi:MAG TPA: hypothetical protein PKA27_09840 [Fimbriimonadaceae bacterium]|nr:hypothetical protein [Fimbriimonadaceae bacterium]
MNRLSILGMSCMREGNDTDVVSVFENCLLVALNANVELTYGRDVRIVGHLFHIGGEFDELEDKFDCPVRYYKAKQHLRTDTVLSAQSWRGLNGVQIKELLATRFQHAMERNVAHALKLRLEFDGPRFLRDVAEGIDEFLNMNCPEERTHLDSLTSKEPPP